MKPDISIHLEGHDPIKMTGEQFDRVAKSITKEAARVDDEKGPTLPGLGNNTAQKLLSLLERVERLNEEQDGLADDVKDIFQEGKSAGFCVKTMRRIIKLRKMDPAKRQEADELEALYRAAIGME